MRITGNDHSSLMNQARQRMILEYGDYVQYEYDSYVYDGYIVIRDDQEWSNQEDCGDLSGIWNDE